jgi:hypothetical protein
MLVGIVTVCCKKHEAVSFSSESFTEAVLEECKSIGCPEITINYVLVSGDRELSHQINSEIKKSIIEVLSLGDDSVKDVNTIEEAASNFIKTYRMHSADFPDMAAEYFVEIDVTESYASVELISFQIHQYLYTGGAHGYENITFKNFNAETGKEIPSKDLFKNPDDFLIFAETKFREAHNIPSNESINANGFLFEDDRFYLSEAIGFTADSVLIYYNQFEISSYAEGPVELRIAKKEIEEYLMFE